MQYSIHWHIEGSILNPLETFLVEDMDDIVRVGTYLVILLHT